MMHGVWIHKKNLSKMILRIAEHFGLTKIVKLKHTSLVSIHLIQEIEIILMDAIVRKRLTSLSSNNAKD